MMFLVLLFYALYVSTFEHIMHDYASFMFMAVFLKLSSALLAS